MKSANLDLKSMPAQLLKVAHKLRRYAVFIFILTILGIFGFLVFRINTLTNAEPTEEALEEQLSTVKRPRLDQSVADKLELLEDTNVEVQTLFNQARDNPFNE
jgi:hypothetical protein